MCLVLGDWLMGCWIFKILHYFKYSIYNHSTISILRENSGSRLEPWYLDFHDSDDYISLLIFQEFFCWTRIWTLISYFPWQWWLHFTIRISRENSFVGPGFEPSPLAFHGSDNYNLLLIFQEKILFLDQDLNLDILVFTVVTTIF